MNFQKLTLSLIAGLIAIGIGVSVLTLYEHLLVEYGTPLGLSANTPFCPVTGQFDCRAVIGSAYGKVFGISLSSWGLAFYGALGIFVFAGAYNDVVSRRSLADVLLLVSALSVIASIALFIVSVARIGKLCPLCLTTYGVNFALFGGAWFLDRSVPFSRRILNGARDIIAFIGALFPRKAALRSGVAWLGVLAYGLWILSIWFLPRYLLLEYVEPALSREAETVSADEARQGWKGADQQDINLRLEEGPFGSYSVGPKDARLVVVQFTDFECPACRAVHQILAPLKKQYADKLLFVHKDFPLDKACNPLVPQEFHVHACFAAEFARCAGEQRKFWEAADFLYEHPGLEDDISPDDLKRQVLEQSAALGLDTMAVEECLASGRQRKPIETDIQEGGRLQIAGTPSLWINGRELQSVSGSAIERMFIEILEGR